MNLKELAEKEWKQHCKTCNSCRKIGKWNKKGGTTESYHAFINGFYGKYKDAQKSTTTSKKKSGHNSGLKKDSHQ